MICRVPTRLRSGRAPWGGRGNWSPRRVGSRHFFLSFASLAVGRGPGVDDSSHGHGAIYRTEAHDMAASKQQRPKNHCHVNESDWLTMRYVLLSWLATPSHSLLFCPWNFCLSGFLDRWHAPVMRPTCTHLLIVFFHNLILVSLASPDS
jgi:4-amino-4-deoxy-L-arabinose transferase-like glycosyltransferase